MLLLHSGDDPPYRGRRNDVYRPEPELVAAANTALTLGLPLLLTGEPGCGKTDFAFVLARWLAEQNGVARFEATDREHGLLECYIRSDTRSRDLLYTYDALRRFGDAHHGGDEGRSRAADPRNYIALEGLGRALASPRRRVVLIDEIDKAPRDLPNDLLRELDQGDFEIAEIPEALPAHPGGLQRRMGEKNRPAERQPIIVITSNAERQLPDAFLRRCVFYHLTFPSTERLEKMLEDRFGPGSALGGARGSNVREKILRPAAGLFSRLHAHQGLVKPPATAELLAWVEALLRLSTDAELGVLAQPVEAIEWRSIPRPECLVKLRDDRITLGLLKS